MREGGGDRIKIFLRDCTVPLPVGIYDHEKRKTQPVVVSIEASAALHQRYDDIKESDLGTVIDYEQLYRFVTADLPAMGHIPFLENIAEQIIAFCFRDRRIESVRVRLEKPEALKGAAHVGIEMHRRRVV